MEIEQRIEYGPWPDSDVIITVTFHTGELARLTDAELEKALEGARRILRVDWKRAKEWINLERAWAAYIKGE